VTAALTLIGEGQAVGILIGQCADSAMRRAKADPPGFLAV